MVGASFVVTTVEPVDEQPFKVAVKEYVPAAAVVTLLIVGFCEVEVNPFGPDQLNDVPLFVVPVRFKTLPTQTGVLLDAEAVGVAFTVTVVLTELLQPLTVKVKVIVVVPGETAVTKPVDAFTLATLGLLLVQDHVEVGYLTITIPDPPDDPFDSPPPPPPPVLATPAL